jgi:demethylmenaquinone methyltransferase / 2-methoxy-6-polyprenyl-1,4-benzoquinol methylase
VIADSSVNVDKSPDRVRDMFRQIAPRYDQMNHMLSAGVDYWWRWRAVRRLKVQPAAPILDVCTGTGDLALAIAKKSPHDVTVIGCDFCHEMLTHGRLKDPQQRVQFVEGDAANLPFADNAFQAVTVAFGLRNVSDTDQGLRELVRVCRPGGQILILEFSQPTAFGIRQFYGFYFRNILPRIGQLFARNNQSAYEYLPNSVGLFPFGNELVERMQRAGMREARYTPLTFGVATLYEARK